MMYISVKLLSTDPMTKKNRTSLRCIIPMPLDAPSDFCQKQPNSQITTEKNTGNLQESAYHMDTTLFGTTKKWSDFYASNLLHINGQSHELPSPHPVAAFWPRRGNFENQDFNGNSR